MKLNLVVCGSNRGLKSFISNLILKQSERRSELSSECVRRDVELDGRLISLVELPALFNTQLSEEEVMRQTHRCVSLCHPGVHVFIFIIPDAPLNNEDRAEIEEIQRIFSSRINKHIMILIKQNPELQTATNLSGQMVPIARSLKTCDIYGIVLCDKTAHFRVAFYCGQPKAHLCNNHAV